MSEALLRAGTIAFIRKHMLALIVTTVVYGVCAVYLLRAVSSHVISTDSVFAVPSALAIFEVPIFLAAIAIFLGLLTLISQALTPERLNYFAAAFAYPFILLCFFLGLLLLVRSCDLLIRVDARQSLAKIDDLVQHAASMEPGKYFDQVAGKWQEISQPIDHMGNDSNLGDTKLSVRKLESGKFEIAVFGYMPAPVGEDLGFVGKSTAANIITLVVWICRPKLSNLDTIDVFLAADAKSRDVYYRAFLRPDTLSAQGFHSLSESGLRDAVYEKTATVSNTAFGYEWVEKP